MYSSNSPGNNQRIGTYGNSQHPAPNQQGGYYVPPGPYREPPHPPPDLLSPFNQQPQLPPPTISYTDQPPAYSALPSLTLTSQSTNLNAPPRLRFPILPIPSQQLTRIQLVQKSIGILVEKLSTVDSQAEFEQDSDGEGGGLRTVTFSGGSALDLGDLNPQNLGDKFAQINWEGSTLIVPGFTKLLDVYNEEFGDFGPSSRPKMVALVITDGEAQDINDLAVMILTMDFTNVYLVFALIGFGKDYENARVRLAELCKLNDHIRLFEMKQETRPWKLRMPACPCVHITSSSKSFDTINTS
ncbi:hypothetical protein BCR33DRAFT_724561 [Rhizoclosmatium globosum]|uniref:VWFA domain-containing protein n=1 Tax=Rhizoclosmatium globosum TaxID=329046 RepID=A0A1Y2B528_9FUNG|nr:hypothetical protein BCR33DRAFT_724561 [Rhizoclosmatium globosum]|eukprot:ORY29942.1 hypothetical protein BCR33DRAFT_724561 [Rhizoclosmatium globosum]